MGAAQRTGSCTASSCPPEGHLVGAKQADFEVAVRHDPQPVAVCRREGGRRGSFGAGTRKQRELSTSACASHTPTLQAAPCKLHHAGIVMAGQCRAATRPALGRPVCAEQHDVNTCRAPEQKALVIDVMKLTEPWKPGTCTPGVAGGAVSLLSRSNAAHLKNCGLPPCLLAAAATRIPLNLAEGGDSQQAHACRHATRANGAHPVVFGHLPSRVGAALQRPKPLLHRAQQLPAAAARRRPGGRTQWSRCAMLLRRSRRAAAHLCCWLVAGLHTCELHNPPTKPAQPSPGEHAPERHHLAVAPHVAVKGHVLNESHLQPHTQFAH